MQYNPAAVVGLTIADVDDEVVLDVPDRDDCGVCDRVVVSAAEGVGGWRVSNVVAQVGTRATKNSRTRSDSGCGLGWGGLSFGAPDAGGSDALAATTVPADPETTAPPAAAGPTPAAEASFEVTCGLVATSVGAGAWPLPDNPWLVAAGCAVVDVDVAVGAAPMLVAATASLSLSLSWPFSFSLSLAFSFSLSWPLSTLACFANCSNEGVEVWVGVRVGAAASLTFCERVASSPIIFSNAARVSGGRAGLTMNCRCISSLTVTTMLFVDACFPPLPPLPPVRVLDDAPMSPAVSTNSTS